MPEPLSPRHAIVSVRSLPEPELVESARAAPETHTDIDPVQRAMLIRRYRQLRDRLEQASRDAGQDVMVAAQDAELSRLQSHLAQIAVEGESLAAGGQEVKFGTGAAGLDWFGWLSSLFHWVDRTEAHPFIYLTTPVAVDDPLPNSCRLAMIGDWGTGLYGAPKIAADIITRAPFDVLLHLGDVYYSGTPEEVRDRFLSMWPFEAGRLHRALNSNHEMYSGGFAYFDMTLPRFGQKASYFAMQNDHWLLIGLDTAYVDHDMDPQQVAWLEAIVGARGNRKVVLFSHQQLFSLFDSAGERLAARLAPLLRKHQITAWYWAHEHQCVLYDRDPEFGLTARCLGNGGIPEPRHLRARLAPIERSVGDITWRRVPADLQAPSGLVLDGPNPDVPGREHDFVPHGYMTLDFDGPVLTERVLLPDGTVVFENELR